jgi:hypothetical protein
MEWAAKYAAARCAAHFAHIGRNLRVIELGQTARRTRLNGLITALPKADLWLAELEGDAMARSPEGKAALKYDAEMREFARRSRWPVAVGSQGAFETARSWGTL